MSKWKAVILLIIVAVFFVGSAAADVPTSPSNVSVEGRQLIVRKRLLDGSLAAAKPYIIKGLTWCPLTRAPQTGVNPFDASENINYGFFFDWDGPNPSGNEVLNYWLRKLYWEFVKQDDAEDIALMQQMNTNTVRLYLDFGDVPDIYKPILDKFYNNGIMVIMTLANSRDEFEEQFYVYKDKDSSDNHFIPSGKMGDVNDLFIEDGMVNPQRAGKSQNYLKNYLKISYSALNSYGQGWAGVYWQNPANNWGEIVQAGYDLSGARRLTFWARGENGGEEIECKIGGIQGVYGDSSEAVTSGKIQLTGDWKKYTLDLSGKELSYVIGGFCFVVNPPAKTFYLDEIRYEGYDIVSQTQEKHYEKIVRLYKDHPAILAWSLGNEWNMNKGWGYADVAEAAGDINEAARRIKALDSFHPVSSCLGDVFVQLEGSNHWLIGDCVNLCPDVDLWGINVYRGASFTNLFEQWEEISAKPFYLSEFGTDSFNTSFYKLLNDYQAADCQGIEDETMQAEFILSLWEEIKACLSAHDSNEVCLGGLVHEFNDELWKKGSFHVGFENVSLGGLVDYDGPDDIPNTSDDDSSYGTYNPEGFFAPGRHPDNLSNEEYFGIVDAERHPKNAFIRLRDYYKLLDDFTAPVITGVKDKGGWTVNKNQLYAEWTAEDGESGIAGYAYRIFTRENGSEKDVIGWTDIGRQDCLEVNYNLSDGKTYYWEIQAVNGAGLKSMLKSDGITVDSISPAIINQTAASQTLPLTFTVKVNDADSGVKEVYLEIDSGTGKVSYPMQKGLFDLYSIPGFSSVSSTEIKYKIISRDNAGNQSTSGSYSLQVINKPPIALIRANRTSGRTPLKVNFYADRCYDTDGKIISYSWDFGNGKTSTQMNPSSTFKNSSWRHNKYYTVSLTVKDNLGAASTAQIKIKVEPWWKCW